MNRIAATFLIVLVSACSSGDGIFPPDTDRLSVGTWGGINAGVIVSDTSAHVHVGCTNGTFAGPILLDDQGRFSATGSYILRAHPIVVGPPLPAQFIGVVDANRLHLTVMVNDTVTREVVTLGPVTVVFGRDPKMGPCPICRPTGLKMINRATDWLQLIPDAEEPGNRVLVPGLFEFTN
jgi:hypothetical protein